MKQICRDPAHPEPTRAVLYCKCCVEALELQVDDLRRALLCIACASPGELDGYNRDNVIDYMHRVADDALKGKVAEKRDAPERCYCDLMKRPDSICGVCVKRELNS